MLKHLLNSNKILQHKGPYYALPRLNWNLETLDT